MLEQEYLELVNQLKENFDTKEKEIEKIKEENIELKKNLMSVYGYIRILDFIANRIDLDVELQNMIDVLRSFLSDVYDDF